MKVVFLDIDGVLNSHRTCIAFNGYPHDLTAADLGMFDLVALGLIRNIVETARAKIVLSSSWRLTHHWAAVGTALDLPIIDETPRLTGPRGAEIAWWLGRHPEVETFAIIDDDADMLDGQLSCFVHTSGFDGFTWANAERLSSILGVSVYDATSSRMRIASSTLDWSAT